MVKVIVVRALQTASAAVIGIATASRLPDKNWAALLAVPFTAVAAILIEYVLDVAPRKWRWIRRRLDPRGVFEGVWIQNMQRADRDRAEDTENRFAVFMVSYSDDKYSVYGRAYDPTGKEHSRWEDLDKHDVHFSKNGRSMTYLWTGTLIAAKAEKKDGLKKKDAVEPTDDLDRTGFASIDLRSDNSGDGRVGHVSMKLNLIFDVQRVTPEELKHWNIDSTPDLLKDTAKWPDFAKKYATFLAAAELRAA